MQRQQDEIIAFLSRPETYGVSGDVARVETHGAIVFLAGERACKLKRAIRYPYMDYSTAEKRAAMCRRELEINRRTAPQIYLETRAIVRKGDGLAFAPDGTEGALDTVLVMRRFDGDTLFGRLCDTGKLTPELMRALAETLADFHAEAEVAPDFGGAAGIGDVVAENNAQLDSMRDAPFDTDAIADYARASKAALAAVREMLDARRDAGKVRRCHGDLHLDNVFLFEGKPTLFDAIEFDDAFACIDVLYDLAFLLMDLEQRGAGNHAHTLLNRYLELTEDYEGLRALPLFLSCRAAIRAHVGVSRAEATGDHAALDGAKDYFALAQRFLVPSPARLVVVGGVSGTGKSTLARALAPHIGAAPGAVILRSDVTRKRLMGVGETERLPESAYTPAVNARVFAALARTAATVLAAGHSAVMDAVYGTDEERKAVEAVADRCGARFDGLWLTAPEPVLIERIAGRRQDASDATAAVLKKQLATLAAPKDWLRLDVSGTPGENAQAAMQRLNL